MSLTWQEWEADLLERERAFERPRVRVTEPIKPWDIWDYTIAVYVVLVMVGLVLAVFGDFSA